MFFFSQNSKLVYIFESLSLKPIHIIGAIHLIVLVPTYHSVSIILMSIICSYSILSFTFHIEVKKILKNNHHLQIESHFLYRSLVHKFIAKSMNPMDDTPFVLKEKLCFIEFVGLRSFIAFLARNYMHCIALTKHFPASWGCP